MLLSSSGIIFPGFSLYSYGANCFYLIEHELDEESQKNYSLFDVGLRVHVAAFRERLKREKRNIEDIRRVFITHLHPERVSGLPYLLKTCPDITVTCSKACAALLKEESVLQLLYDEDQRLSKLSMPKSLQLDEPELDFAEYCSLFKVHEIVPETHAVELSSVVTVRCMKLSGHAVGSLGYLIEPFDILIVDESCGYFRGRELPVPGADVSVKDTVETIRRLSDLEISGLCLPQAGILSGSLIRRYLNDYLEVLVEAEKSTQEERGGFIDSFVERFSSPFLMDPLLNFSMKRSLGVLPEG